MKWFNPPKTLEGLKKRGQWYLLTINIIVATANFLLLSNKIENNRDLVLVCEPINYAQTICQEIQINVE